MAERVVVMILGARSGTSALAGTLGLLGGTLPKHLMGAHASNSKGHFEPVKLADLHDKLLAEVGSRWDDWRSFPQAWFYSQSCTTYLAALKEAFLYDYSDFTTAVLKEPRISRLLPLWWRLLQELGMRPAPLFIYRNPVEVAQSLSARDASTEVHGLLYWLRNQLDAEFSTRGTPRSFVLFDELLGDWRGVISRIEVELDIRLPKRCGQSDGDVDGFLEPALRHQHRPDSGNHRAGPIYEWAQKAFESLDELRVDPTNQTAMRELDRIHVAFDDHTR